MINGIDVKKHPYRVKKIIGVQLQANEYFDKLDLSELLILFGKLIFRRNRLYGSPKKGRSF